MRRIGSSPNERARTRNVDIGLVFQSFNLIGDLTVYENVEYPLTIKGASSGRAPPPRDGRARACRSVRARHAAAVVVCQAVISSSWPSRGRSPGQPPIVLADEPTGNLDSAAGEVVMQTIQELHASGSTICLATHNPHYIAMAATAHQAVRRASGRELGLILIPRRTLRQIVHNGR